MANLLKKGKIFIFWTLNVLKYSLPILNTFFSQLFSFLFKAADCKNANNHNSGFPCISKRFYQVQILISIISIFILIFLCFLKETFYYKANFFKEGKDIIKKDSSIPNRIFLLYKIIIVTCFILDYGNENYHWILLAIVIITTGINAYFTNFNNIYSNKKLNRITQFFSIILFWGYISLLVGKIFLLSGYNGSLYLFISGLFVIALIKFYITDKNINFAKIDFNEINSSKTCIYYIKYYLYLVENKDKCNDCLIILRTLIERRETCCVNNNCALKKYLTSLDNGTDSNFLLLQFVNTLYEISINKFPTDVDLKINYIIFLLTEENRKKKALKILVSLNPNFIYLENNFNIFRVSKYIEEYNLNDKQIENEILNKDILEALEYKNYFAKFKNLLNKVSNLYHEFWYLIFGSQVQGMEDFKKINDIGVEIHKFIEKVEKYFEILYKINSNNPEILKLYLNFTKNILNDNEKFEKYHNIMININNKKINNTSNIDYINFDMKLLNETDDNQFLIVSANENNLGIIYNISLSLSTLFGYNKTELIGKNINIFIPELFQKSHDKILSEYTEKITSKFYENFSYKTKYFQDSKELFVYSRNKSRYLIPIFLKIHFVFTEENEHIYIIEVNGIDSKSIIDSNYLISDDKKYTCCLITDNNLFIQFFTPNSIEILGLNSKVINSNYEITQFIKEFKEDLYSLLCPENNEYYDFEMTELLSSKSRSPEKNKLDNFNLEDYLTNMPIEKKIKYKKILIKNKYSCNHKITWINMLNKSKELKINSNNTQKFNSPKNLTINNHRNSYSKNNNDKIKLIKEKFFYMIVKEIKMKNENVGYRFLFKAINNELETKKNKSIKLTSNKLSINTITDKQKYNLLKSETNTKKNFGFFINDAVNFNTIKIIPTINLNNFIPKCDFNFYLDMNKMVYKPNFNKNSNENTFLENLKNKAIEKITIFQNNINEQKKNNDSYNSTDSYSDSGEYEQSEEEDENPYSSSNIEQSKIKTSVLSYKINNSNKNLERNMFITKQNTFTPIQNKLYKRISNINDVKKEFYKVNIDKIRFMIFDFQKETIIESKEQKISQVEKIINNCNNESFNNCLNEDMSYLSSKSLNFIKLKKISNKKSSNNFDTLTNNKNNIESKDSLSDYILNKEKTLEKEIADALDENDSQNVVSIFIFISFITFFLIFGMIFFEIYFIKLRSFKIKKLYNLISNAVNLRYWISYGIYYIRELTLLNMNNGGITNGTYIGMPAKNKTLYISSIKEIIKVLYFQGHTSISKIIGTDIIFSDKLNNTLNFEPYTMIALLPNFEMKFIISSLANSMIQLFCSFYVLCTSYAAIQQNQDDLYNFLYNSLNSMNRGLKIQSNMIFVEFSINCGKSLVFIAAILIVFLIIYIFCYLITIFSFSYIPKKKLSYITVFFGIDLSIIKSSIIKCEKFTNEFNKNDEYLSFKDEDKQNEEEETLSSSNIISQLSKEDTIVKHKFKVKNKQNNKKIKNDTNFKKFRTILIIILVFSFIFSALIILLYFKLITNLLVYGEYIYRMQKLPNNIIELFNTYREFLFDNESIILGENCLIHLKNLENETYFEKPDDSRYLSKNYDKLGTELAKYFDDFNTSCHLMNNYYFNNWSECMEYYGPIGYNNYQALMIYFIDEIRISRNLVSLLLDQNKIIGNLTRYNGTSTYKNLNLSDNFVIFRLELFNMNDTHKELNLFFSNIIMPYFEEERNATLNAIKNKMSGQENVLYILAAVHIIIIVYIIFAYWVPMIKWISFDLYKTKNMLTIIPVQILSAQPDIKILLNIKDKNN